jgi:Ca-activated chloride channel family protein
MMTALLLPVMFILSAFTINVAYLQLTRTEMMVATDAAARASGRTMSELQNVALARQAGEITAAFNEVASSPLVLTEPQIIFGTASNSANQNGRYEFQSSADASIQSGDAPANAVMVSSIRGTGYGGQVVTPFPSFGMEDRFDIDFDAVAMQVDRDIALVLDRSGSMDWKTFNWPDGTNPWQPSVYNAAVQAGVLTRINGNYYYSSGQDSDSFQDWAWEEHFELGTPPNTPWEDLELAVESFLSVLNGTVQTERVSLSSYSTNSSLDLDLTSNYDAILTELNTLGPSGMTAIGSGMDTSLPSLFDSTSARPLAAKTMIVMTDGMHNTGTDPVTIATQIVAQYNVTIHSVTFSPGADQDRMEEVAEIGGGQHYHAENGEELIEVFETIANNLPTILTK